ncbi:MAG: ABC transporter ATP-binding protein [Defluviitaleaceae bacterium]|nr:ABC transporter ATP-binding protein [Defluviitaleaceae bacterium]MCL2263423.1 ABC transporter ATP-binding protein [Defluviitaleaceae bacterium]
MIKVENLTKEFDGYTALKNFCMNVNKGSIYGLVGVNGAGKTTAIKHLAGVFKGDGGRILIDEIEVYDNEKVKERVGYIPDDLYFFPQYNLKMLGKFHEKLYKNWNENRFTELTQLMGLDVKRRVGRFSKGMQKQAGLALVLSCMPEVLLLDEPIDGLDPIVRKKIFQWIIEDVADRQMTVLISSHNLKEMDGICDTVGIIKDGQMLIERDLDELKAEMADNTEFEHQPPSLDEIFIYVYEKEAAQ